MEEMDAFSMEVYMEERGLLCFLSEETVSAHKEYARSLCCAEEAHRKGVAYDGRPLISLYRARRRADTAALYRCAVESAAHALYFSSFTDYPTVDGAFCQRFGGVTAFFQRVMEAAEASVTFLFVGVDRRGELLLSSDIEPFLRQGRMPHLCLDLFEHAYLFDYGFRRDAYLRAAIGHLDVGRLLTEEAQRVRKM